SVQGLSMLCITSLLSLHSESPCFLAWALRRAFPRVTVRSTYARTGALPHSTPRAMPGHSGSGRCKIRPAPMHEVSLVSAAIAAAVAAAQRAGARRVERLTFALAPSSHVTREAVETLVAALAARTLVEGAAVAFEPHADQPGRPELVLASIDVEVP